MTSTTAANKSADVTSQSNPDVGIVCAVLASVLKDGVDVHRCQAAIALGRIGSSESVGPLIDALLDEDEDVRTDVAEALELLGDPAAADQLFKNLLGDPCTEVKLAAINSLATLQDRRVIPWLRRMVLGRDEEITWDEEEFFSSGWDDWVEIQVRAIAALAEFGASEAVPDIVKALDDENAQDMSEMAFKALGRMGPEGIRAVAGYLNAPTTRPRRRAAAVLARHHPDAIQGVLARVFSDTSPDVRMAGLRARAAVEPGDPWVTTMLSDDDAEIRVEAIGLADGLYAVDLLDLLDDPSERVQVAALKALGHAKDLRDIGDLPERLSSKFQSPISVVAAAAARCFAIVAPLDAVEVLAEYLADTALDTKRRLGALHGLSDIDDPRSVAALIGAIDDAERQIRLEALAALAGVAGKSADWPNAASEALLTALNGVYTPEPPEPIEVAEAEPEKSDDSEADAETNEESAAHNTTLAAMLAEAPGIASAVGLPEQDLELTAEDMERLAIARKVVGKRKIPRAVDVVLHEDIQRFAAKVLGGLDLDDVVQALTAKLEDDDPELVMAAAQSIAAITERSQILHPDIEKALIDRLADAACDLKLPLIRAISVGDEREVSDVLLQQLSDEDSFVRTVSVRALSKVGVNGADIAHLLSDDDAFVRQSAATVLAKVAGSESAERLINFAFSYEGRHGRQAAKLLRQVDADAANSAFLEVLIDPEQSRRWTVAIEALEEINQHKQEQTPGLVS